jgi:DNA invertase Pin-like site-specific DNA recombinase
MAQRSERRWYIRVSRRTGREEELFISPELQRKNIEGWAKLHAVEIVRWWEEIDQSGAKLERPMLQDAPARCKRGERVIVTRADGRGRHARPIAERTAIVLRGGATLEPQAETTATRI